ncbi:hypothetical protein F8271_13345 [Micromonospora sp. ALFpr18c]|uniref:hypothetical protein n=1 Tax=Micromonospora sp. ALFpr18c TaxID=1458665 RepID=UPI00124AF3AF|nr:hypothetical protein [Micromonospora sp. ALFpr18c]KAB1942215.1 hypothetical protein F8271_13345 [Micromonospora sp. ALFpr18c]
MDDHFRPDSIGVWDASDAPPKGAIFTDSAIILADILEAETLRAASAFPKDAGTLRVFAHAMLVQRNGRAQHMPVVEGGVVPAKTLAAWIARYGSKAKSIELIVCHAGSGGKDSYAVSLARMIRGRTVHYADGAVTTTRSGRVFIGEGATAWRSSNVTAVS